MKKVKVKGHSLIVEEDNVVKTHTEQNNWKI